MALPAAGARPTAHKRGLLLQREPGIRSRVLLCAKSESLRDYELRSRSGRVGIAPTEDRHTLAFAARSRSVRLAAPQTRCSSLAGVRWAGADARLHGEAGATRRPEEAAIRVRRATVVRARRVRSAKPTWELLWPPPRIRAGKLPRRILIAETVREESRASAPARPAQTCWAKSASVRAHASRAAATREGRVSLKKACGAPSYSLRLLCLLRPHPAATATNTDRPLATAPPARPQRL